MTKTVEEIYNTSDAAKYFKLLKVPTGVDENLAFRYRLLHNMKQSAEFERLVLDKCKQDIFFWLECFCYTHDPRKNPSRLPFLLYDYQKDFVKDLVAAIEKGENLCIEKSRDLGISWLVVLTFQWFWLFRGTGNDFLLGSYKEPYVDARGAIDSLFEKFRYNFYTLPASMRPKNFNKNEHDKVMLIINPDSSNYLRGQTNSHYFGSGGRYKAVLFDEFAKWDHSDESAWKSASDTTRCKIAVSSANGKSNHFYKLRSGKAGSIKTLKLHWTLHPEKTKKWYNEQKKIRSAADVAAELDINYAESVENKAAHNFDSSIHVRKFDYIPNMPLELNCDFNINPMCWSISQTLKGVRYTFDEFTVNTTITEEVCNKVLAKYANHQNKILRIYGDPAGRYGSTKSRHSDYAIIQMMFNRAGWQVYIEVASKHPALQDRMNSVNKRLKDWENKNCSWEYITPNCVNLIDSIEQTQRIGDKLIKNDLEHHFDAWSYSIAFKYPVRYRRY